VRQYTTQYKPLERIVEEDVLSSQLEQHRVVEEFVDGHVFTQSLSPASLDHEFSGQVCGWLRLQRSDDDALVQRVARNNLTYSKGVSDILKKRV